MERWFITMKKADFNAIAEKYHISPILARLIRNRDVTGDEAINLYLNGTIADLYDGMLMKDMDRAVEILSEKIREEKLIRVIGDYDIDGVNATYILQQGLSGLGADVDTDIPDEDRKMLEAASLSLREMEREVLSETAEGLLDRMEAAAGPLKEMAAQIRSRVTDMNKPSKVLEHIKKVMSFVTGLLKEAGRW